VWFALCGSQTKAIAVAAGNTKFDPVGMIAAFKAGVTSGTRYTFADGLALVNAFRTKP
jgi:hypothetical protein